MAKKKLVFRHESRRVGRSSIIINESIKETDTTTREKYCFWWSFGEIKFDLTLKKSDILYKFTPYELSVSQLRVV